MANVSSSNGIEKYPKLRFPSFDKPYKQCRISDIYAERNQRGASDMVLLSVTMNDGVMPRSEIEGKDNSSEDKSNYKVVFAGDMVYNSMRMWQGANGISPCDGIVSPAYTVLVPKIPISNGYFAALFKSPNLINEFRKNSQGMTSDTWNLKYPQIETIKVSIPTLSEQERIAEMLDFLEKRIARQTELVDNLKKYKRGVTNNIFNGYFQTEIVPTVNSKWSECLLSDVSTFHQGLTYSPSDIGDSGCLVLRSSNIQDSRLSFQDNVFVSCEITEKLKVKENDVLMCVRNGSKHLVGKTAIIDRDYPNMTWGAFMMVIRSQLKNTFVYHYLNSDLFYNQVFKDTGTATINQITKGTLNECKIPMPHEKTQRNICKFLDLLNTKLHNEEEYLDKLLKLKHGLLQQLFI